MRQPEVRQWFPLGPGHTILVSVIWVKPQVLEGGQPTFSLALSNK
jgi:hypothetical protein